jgi:hypothetical protein
MKFRYPFYKKKQKDPFIFLFVRNPIDWYESYFKYILKLKFKRFSSSINHLHPMSSLNDCYSEDFNIFIDNIIKKEPGYLTNLFARYVHSDKVSFIGKQENLAADLIEALGQTSLTFDERKILQFPEVNKSEEKRIDWSKKNYSLILRHEKLIYHKFKYTIY